MGSSLASSSQGSVYYSGQASRIDDLSSEERNDVVDYIEVIDIPVGDSAGGRLLDIFSKIIFDSYGCHEALLIKTRKRRFFVCQTYPKQLKKCNSEKEVYKEIQSYWEANSNGSFVYVSRLKIEYNITMEEIKNIVESLPNYYDLATYNCQKFCEKICEKLGLEYKIGSYERDI